MCYKLTDLKETNLRVSFQEQLPKSYPEEIATEEKETFADNICLQKLISPSKGRVNISNWLNLSHTQNSSSNWKGVWETCLQLSSPLLKGRPREEILSGYWMAVHCVHSYVCSGARMCTHAYTCPIYIFACVCICAHGSHVHKCVHASVHVCTCVIEGQLGE